MREGSETYVPERRRPVSSAFGILTLALCACLLSGECNAAGPSGPVRAPEVVALLASSNVLSEAAMAQQTGTGLGPPAIITNEEAAAPRVLLWDELKPAPLMPPVTSGMTTGGNAQ